MGKGVGAGCGNQLHILTFVDLVLADSLAPCAGKVWQDEYFDTVIRRSDSLQAKIDYVRQNLVRAGLVKCPEDYRWMWELPRPRAATAPNVRFDDVVVPVGAPGPTKWE